MTVGELLTQLAETARIDKNNPAYKDLFANTAEVPADFVTSFNAAGLMTVEAAKQNPLLKKHFFHNALDPIDQDINTAFDEHGLDDAAREEFKRESSTYKKVTMLRKKIAELESAKHSATGTDKDKLKEEIKKLNDQVLKTKETYEQKIKLQQEGEDARMLDYAIRSGLSARKYPNDKVKHGVNMLTAYNVINDALKEKGGKLVFADKDKTAVKLVSSENPDLDFTVNNKSVSYEAFVEQTLADNGMTIVSDPKANGKGNHIVDISKLPEGQRPPAELLKAIQEM